MIKVFISQPMREKTDDQIMKDREQAINICRNIFQNEIIEILDSYFEEFVDSSNKNPGVYYLGKSISKLSEADVAYFCPGWKNARGCIIEHEVAKQYEIRIIEATE